MTERIRTNNQRRELIHGHELTDAEREWFDYIDWAKVDEGTESALFFRFKGDLYDMSSFERLNATPGWDAGMATSAFGGILIRLDPDDTDYIVVGESFS